VNCYSIQEPPGFKLGDGKWGMNTPQGNAPSQKGLLYKIEEKKYDIIHINHKPIGEHLLKLYPNSPFINTVHSEVIPNLEEPVIDEVEVEEIEIEEVDLGDLEAITDQINEQISDAVDPEIIETIRPIQIQLNYQE
ncbi:MAG: hypothetical protein ACO3NI_15555, partial [bacterium]